MAAVVLQVIPNIHTSFSKNKLFVSANRYEKYFVSKEYCIARHDDKMCFLPNCRFDTILIEDITEFLQILDAFCFNYQHVDCLYTLLKYRFNGDIFDRSGQVFDNMERAVYFNRKNKPVDRMPSIARKKVSRERVQKKTFVEPLP